MNETDLKVLVDIVRHYFLQQSGTAAEMGTPFLSDTTPCRFRLHRRHRHLG
jgi:hypothetical protein